MSIEPLWFDVAPVFEEWLETEEEVALRVGDYRRGVEWESGFPAENGVDRVPRRANGQSWYSGLFQGEHGMGNVARRIPIQDNSLKHCLLLWHYKYAVVI